MSRGERFEVDLGSDDDDDNQTGKRTPNQTLPGAFIGDVLERQPGLVKPPSAPTLKSKNGFPGHQKRSPAVSKFKPGSRPTTAGVKQPFTDVVSKTTVESEEPTPSATSGNSPKPQTWEEQERVRIDQENRQRLADMTPAEVEDERRELMRNLNPTFIQRLMQRSRIDSGSNETDLAIPPGDFHPGPADHVTKAATTKTVSFAAEPTATSFGQTEKDDAEEPNPDHADLANYHDDDHQSHDTPLPSSLHFPQPPQPPSLDPSSSTFLADLHEKYFPSLPTDPSKLAWMQSPSPTSPNNTSYSPSSPHLTAPTLRFSFHGQLLPPTTAALIPVTEGLHHHADAPDAAGYTIPELALLARSSYAAQRCIAFQTLGRILYRLGKGEFGDSGEAEGTEVEGGHGGGDGGEAQRGETFGELARGLWGVVEKESVVDCLVRESEGRGVDGGRHVSAKAYATEAVWLWRKGGGRRWKAA